jgi:ParB family chromosome partitioning protein
MAGNTTPKLPMADPTKLVIVGLDTNDGDTHELYDERAMMVLDENLVKNIMAYGVLQPVIVREEAGKLLVVDGRQRVRAAREAKKQQKGAGEFEVKVPYTTHGVVGADRQRLTGVMISTNEIRRTDEILVKMAKCARLKAQGASLEECAIAFGRSVVTIRQWLKLLEAHHDLLEAVRIESVAISAAHEIAKYDKADQPKVMRELQKQAGRGNRVTEALAKAYRADKGDSTASSKAKATATKATPTTTKVTQSKVTAAQTKANKANGNPGLSEAAKKLLAKTPATTPAATPKGTKAQPRQAGVKRLWLRDALKTEAAKKLSDEQRGVLQWFATGMSDDKSWFAKFQATAEAEMAKAKSKK